MNHRNTWSGGRNADLSPSFTPSNQYLEAQNVELVGEGSFQSLRNIQGTTLVQQLSSSATLMILQVLPAKFVINGELVECLVIFSVDTTFKIQAFDAENEALYDLFEEDIDDDYRAEVKGVDARNHPENGTDIVYFTDGINELRYLKCEIPSPYVANFLTAYDISLLRKGANGTITATVGTTGTLLSGSYSFCYRMCDPTEKVFTKWSSPTNPVHVYSAENGTSVVNSGIGLITDRKITLTIAPSFDEVENLGHIQVAVIEYTGPTEPITASLLEIEAFAGTSHTLEYKSNSQIGTVPLEDVTVDLAALKTAKTLAIKDNRLFGGNVSYTSLEFDNGTPAITSGSIITQASSDIDSFSSDEFASKYRGYFRGETYRFGIVYYDKNGNRSSVQPLDLSGVTNNDISGSLTDLKFPDRTSSSFTLFNSSGQIQSLGLRLTGLNNHPSWARSLEIVRVDRKGRFKNILFQTPIIPMVRVYGTGALERYPTQVTYNEAGDERTVDDATPMTSGYTLVPKNLFWPENREIFRVHESSGTGVNAKSVGEAKLEYVVNADHSYSMVWPAQSMYEPTKPFQYSGAEKVEFIDHALLKLDIDEDTPAKSIDVVQGDDANTNISGTFYALSNNQYYFSNGHAKASLGFTDKPVTDYKFFDNLGQPTSVGGKSTMDYASLQTVGVDLGFKPDIQRSAVVKLGGTQVVDPTESSLAFSAATWNAYFSGSSSIALTSASATLKHESSSTFTNKYVTEYAGFSPNSSFVNVVSIVNFKTGVSDNRYGESTDLHEYISTGTRYTFSSAEIATLEAGGDVVLGNLDVWGGDCFVGPHIFKVCDSAYSIVNQPKNNGSAQTDDDLLLKWPNGVFKNFPDTAILSLPVAVENAAQYIQVVLESEYNGEVREKDILEGSSATIPVMTGEVSTARTPLTYKYNINLSKLNSQKIYVAKPQFSFEQNEFGSRTIFSDLKIYNSDQAGFDIFRVSNFYDIEEKYRTITKLSVAGNQLYSIHENGIVYLPTGERMLEQSDAGTLAVRSGDVIGQHLVIDSERGCQHLRGIVETGSVIYIPDNSKRSIYALAGQQLQPITFNNETVFRSMLGSKIDGKYLVGVYDPIRREYWIANADPSACAVHCHVFNETINEGRGGWISNYSMGKTLRGYGMANQTLYLVGANGSDTSIYSAYTGDCGQIFGVNVDSTVKFAVNSMPHETKVFDNIIVDASQRLSTADYEIAHESERGNQTSSVTLDIVPREGNYRTWVMPDSTGERMRGMYMLTTLTWKNVQSALKAVDTIFRMSARSA